MATYLALDNYRNNLLRSGFTADDLDHGGSDRLVDAIVLWGTPESIASRLGAHHAAGADHVCVHVVSHGARDLPMADWRRLAELVR
jgi:alkanesulfonate monooxygenase SsuD/methylene tetrahydromethanopterin reductase-like flavin-dependent oxidoreductase (luciferase family)